MKIALGKVLKSRNMKQAELARKTGLTPGYISGLVSGQKNPSQEVLAKILTALEATPAEIFLTSTDAPTIPSLTKPKGMQENGAHFIPEGTKPETAHAHAQKNAKHLTLMRASKDHIGLAILAGDVLHVDLSQKDPQGQISIATCADLNNGEATTLIRRIAGDLVLPVDASEEPMPLESNTYSFAVLGTVIAIERKL